MYLILHGLRRLHGRMYLSAKDLPSAILESVPYGRDRVRDAHLLQSCSGDGFSVADLVIISGNVLEIFSRPAGQPGSRGKEGAESRTATPSGGRLGTESGLEFGLVL